MSTRDTRKYVQQVGKLIELTEKKMIRKEGSLVESLHLGGDEHQPTHDEASRTGLGRLASQMQPSFDTDAGGHSQRGSEGHFPHKSAETNNGTHTEADVQYSGKTVVREGDDTETLSEGLKLRKVGSNQSELHIGDHTILFSYETPVAAHHPSTGPVHTSTRYSQTTSKHISAWKQRHGFHSSREVPQEHLHDIVRKGGISEAVLLEKLALINADPKPDHGETSMGTQDPMGKDEPVHDQPRDVKYQNSMVVPPDRRGEYDADFFRTASDKKLIQAFREGLVEDAKEAFGEGATDRDIFLMLIQKHGFGVEEAYEVVYESLDDIAEDQDLPEEMRNEIIEAIKRRIARTGGSAARSRQFREGQEAPATSPKDRKVSLKKVDEAKIEEAASTHKLKQQAKVKAASLGHKLGNFSNVIAGATVAQCKGCRKNIHVNVGDHGPLGILLGPIGGEASMMKCKSKNESIQEARPVHRATKSNPSPACGAGKKFQDLVRDFETTTDPSKVTCTKPKCVAKKVNESRERMTSLDDREKRAKSLGKQLSRVIGPNCEYCGLKKTDAAADLHKDARGKTWCRDVAQCEKRAKQKNENVSVDVCHNCGDKSSKGKFCGSECKQAYHAEFVDDMSCPTCGGREKKYAAPMGNRMHARCGGCGSDYSHAMHEGEEGCDNCGSKGPLSKGFCAGGCKDVADLTCPRCKEPADKLHYAGSTKPSICKSCMKDYE